MSILKIDWFLFGFDSSKDYLNLNVMIKTKRLIKFDKLIMNKWFAKENK